MNKNLDLTKILEGCPEGTEFYSSVFGEVKFISLDFVTEPEYPVVVDSKLGLCSVAKDGKTLNECDGECTLFPSRTQRDWSKFERFWDKPKVEKFDINTLQPFDKVLVKDADYFEWNACLFSHISSNEYADLAMCDGEFWRQVIPYNEETKHLIGTTNDCPEYYKWWEK